MIFVGIDDTDTLDTPGTNQLARALVERVAGRYRCVRIVRHQLLDDPRVPCTSKNGSASIVLTCDGAFDRGRLIADLRDRMRAWFVPGSDPGLCVAETVAPALIDFGRRCQRELVHHAAARCLAAECRVHLEGLGGTEGGVIGALAAVGLAATGDDGRVVQIGGWPDDLAGVQAVGTIRARGVEVRCRESGGQVDVGLVDVGKHLRPNCRGGKIVLFVEPVSNGRADDDVWQAIRLT